MATRALPTSSETESHLPPTSATRKKAPQPPKQPKSTKTPKPPKKPQNSISHSPALLPRLKHPPNSFPDSQTPALPPRRKNQKKSRNGNTRSQSYKRRTKIVLCKLRSELQNQFRVKKMTFGEISKKVQMDYLSRGSSAPRVKSCQENGNSVDISVTVPKIQGNQKRAFWHFLDSQADETLNDLVSLLNHPPTESRSSQVFSPKSYLTSPNHKNSVKNALKITRKNTKNRTSSYKKSSPKFRIIKNTLQTIKMPARLNQRQGRRSSQQTTPISYNHYESPNGSQFFTRIRKKSKVITIKSPKNRKSSICGFFQENGHRKQKIIFFRFPRHTKDSSSSFSDQDDDEDSVSKIDILEDQNYLTNKRQDSEGQRF